MKTLIYITLLICSTLEGLSQPKIPGSYKSNFAIKGSFVERLRLTCDSTFEFTRYGDAKHPVIKGKWGYLDEHVFLIADTANGQKNGYFWQTFFYQNGRLLAFSPTDYRMYVKSKLGSADSSTRMIDIPEPNKALYKHTGRFRLYYLAKVGNANCNSKQN